MKKRDFGIRLWLLLCAVAATITATEVFGVMDDGDMMRSACEERFNMWYGAADAENSEETIVEYASDFNRLEDQLAEMEALVEERDTLPIHHWEVTKCNAPKSKRISEQRIYVDSSREVVPIEVYDGDTTSCNFNRFIDKLLWGQEVRIAFMGDSFIEGDILTSDFREALQTTFGGRGVGFVQCDIPFATSRKTVKRSVSGWAAYSVLKPKNNPSTINDNFFVSGYTARGSKGAKASWRTTTAFEHLDSCQRARILLSTADSASVRVTINKDTTLRRQFDFVNVGLPQEIRFEGSVESVDLEVLYGDVDCYGASLEGCGGVIVDNLSMRANSGHAIFGTSAVVNKQIDAYVGYDLVVLQYGLNIMEAGRTNYSAYRNKLNEMIAYAKSCFPDAAILVLGVSDRWTKGEDGAYAPIGSVESMMSYQRGAAEASAVSFWPTADAMALYGGMPGFVSNGWAAKDYTHINFAGGKRVGEELYRSIIQYAKERLKSGMSKTPVAATITYAQPIKVERVPAINNDSVSFVAPTQTTPHEEPQTESTNMDSGSEQVSVETHVDEQQDAPIASDSIATEQPIVEQTELSEQAGDMDVVVDDVVVEEAPVEESTIEVNETETVDASSEVVEDDEFFITL